MNQFIKVLTALGMIFTGIGQMLVQYNTIMQQREAAEVSDSSPGDNDGK